MSVSKFKVIGQLDGADGGSLFIHRESGIVGVRPKGRHRTYDLPLRDVAEMILCRVVLAEKAEAEKSK